MPAKLPRPTDVELQILDVFWEHGPCTVRAAHQVIIASKERKQTSYSTTLKMIQVLHEKGFLSRDASVRPQIYQATVSREETQKSMVEDIVQRLFGGAMNELVQCAISSKKISKDELQELQGLIRQAKKGQDQ